MLNLRLKSFLYKVEREMPYLLIVWIASSVKEEKTKK